MKFYSTKNKTKAYTLREAVLKGLPDDKGLFMPDHFPAFSQAFLATSHGLEFRDIAYETASLLLAGSLDKTVLRQITDEAINFDAPLVEITEGIYALELFHGPTLAFKDFGARFMAGLMSYFVKNENKKLTILVATSGDTGGAVADGFYGKEGIEVIILFPSGKVSALQEKQLTTPGLNVTAVEVSGTFDDCQRMVKASFSDAELAEKYWLSSANSINIARLIPQSFYYVYAWSRLSQKKLPVVFSVPSGNFGNLTAGLFAQKMGLPVDHFIAATNINDIVPNYLDTGIYEPAPSRQTISNAMDVGDPSNFSRMIELFENDYQSMKSGISGFSANDMETREAISQVYQNRGYLLDPHGAVGYLALTRYLVNNKKANGVFLETAHPAKFNDVVESITGKPVELPASLQKLIKLNGKATKMSNNQEDFKSWLLKR